MATLIHKEAVKRVCDKHNLKTVGFFKALRKLGGFTFSGRGVIPDAYRLNLDDSVVDVWEICHSTTNDVVKYAPLFWALGEIGWELLIRKVDPLSLRETQYTGIEAWWMSMGKTLEREELEFDRQTGEWTPMQYYSIPPAATERLIERQKQRVGGRSIYVPEWDEARD